MWEIVKGNLVNRRATSWTVSAILILTYAHLAKYILKMLADMVCFFFLNGNLKMQLCFVFFFCFILAAEDFQLYYKLARSYNKPFLSQLNGEMKSPKVGLALVGTIITQEPLIQSI